MICKFTDYPETFAHGLLLSIECEGTWWSGRYLQFFCHSSHSGSSKKPLIQSLSGSHNLTNCHWNRCGIAQIWIKNRICEIEFGSSSGNENLHFHLHGAEILRFIYFFSFSIAQLARLYFKSVCICFFPEMKFKKSGTQCAQNVIGDHSITITRANIDKSWMHTTMK